MKKKIIILLVTLFFVVPVMVGSGEAITIPCLQDADCNDYDACTVDRCDPVYGCVYLMLPIVCDDGNICTTDACDPATGLCAYTPIIPCVIGECGECIGDPDCPEGMRCDIGSGCFPSCSCVPGGPCPTVCTYHCVPADCNDDNACTVDAYVPDVGCTHTPINCSDDGNPCTDEVCNPLDGTCVSKPNSNPCDDGNACTINDTCGCGTCLPGKRVNCEDGISCTKDTCDPATGLCLHTDSCQPLNGTCQVDGLCCDPANGCVIVDWCFDDDNDGYGVGFCMDLDCNDHNAAIHPAAIEVCDDCVDNDCDGLTDMADPDCAGPAFKSIYITGGGFAMGVPADPTTTRYNPFSHISGDVVANHPLNDDILLGSFQGSPNFDPLNHRASLLTGIVGFQFHAFGPVAAYTSPDNLNDTSNPMIEFYSPPSLHFNSNTGEIVLNIESWTAGWNSYEYNQGNSNVTATFNPAGTNYGWDVVFNWPSPIVGGPFDGQIGYWRVEGILSEVSNPCDPNPCTTPGPCEDGPGTCTDVNGSAVCDYAPRDCPSGATCDPVMDMCMCTAFPGGTVIIRGGGGKPTGTDLEVLTKYTTLSGCIVDASASSVTVSSGSDLQIDCTVGHGVSPTAVWLDGVLQTNHSSIVINFPEVTTETNRILKATNKAQKNDPSDQPTGKDTDRMTIKIVP